MNITFLSLVTKLAIFAILASKHGGSKGITSTPPSKFTLLVMQLYYTLTLVLTLATPGNQAKGKSGFTKQSNRMQILNERNCFDTASRD